WNTIDIISFPTRRSSDLSKDTNQELRRRLNAQNKRERSSRSNRSSFLKQLENVFQGKPSRVSSSSRSSGSRTAVRTTRPKSRSRSEEHTSELQSRFDSVC